MGVGVECLIVIGLGIAALIAYAYLAHKRFEADPWGGVTDAELGALVRALSGDEEMLTFAPLRRLPLGLGEGGSEGVHELTGVACLTHRRLVIREADRYAKTTIIQLRHITGYAAFGEAGTIHVTTTDGRTYGLSGGHLSAWRRFREQLSALLERQSSAAGLAGAGNELEKLADLVNRGILESADFDRAKGLMLGKPASQLEDDIRLLENLHALWKQGVLSESEFNMKKWDVLSRAGAKR